MGSRHAADGFDHVFHEDGDDVFSNKETGIVILDLSQCASHRQGFCKSCRPRLKRLVAFADKLMKR